MEDYIIATCTDTGKVRSVNEDSMATFDSPNGRVVVVCDGMGGQNAGDVASQLAVTVIQDILTDNKFNTPEEAITKSIIAANQAILVKSSQDIGLSGMGSTCVMLIITDNKVYYGSVGDSRIYYIANGMIRQLTKDQSYVQTLVDAGELTQEAAEHHKDKNQITNALGIEGMTPPVVCQMPITPEPGSIFLLCSDGLSGMVNNSVINQVISNPGLTLQDKANELINLANNAGGVDNITVQLVEFPQAFHAQGIAPSGTSGNRAARKPEKSKATVYWIVGIVCVILAIAGFTFWKIKTDESNHKPIKAKTETPVNKTKTTKPVQPTSPAAPAPQASEPTQVKIIETTKPEKPKTDKNKKTEPADKTVKKVLEKQDNPEKAPTEEVIKEMKTNDLSGEK